MFLYLRICHWAMGMAQCHERGTTLGFLSKFYMTMCDSPLVNYYFHPLLFFSQNKHLIKCLCITKCHILMNSVMPVCRCIFLQETENQYSQEVDQQMQFSLSTDGQFHGISKVVIYSCLIKWNSFNGVLIPFHTFIEKYVLCCIFSFDSIRATSVRQW